MPAPVVIVEDGSNVANANSYISVADCTAFHTGHLYADDWNNADATHQATAVIMATRTIDISMDWDGYRSNPGQALEWPRLAVPNTDDYFAFWGTLWLGGGSSLMGNFVYGPYYPANVIPGRLRTATCELARGLLKLDRTADYAAKGISRLSVGQNAIDIGFTGSTSDRPQVFTDFIKSALQPFGQFRFNRSMARVHRG